MKQISHNLLATKTNRTRMLMNKFVNLLLLKLKMIKIVMYEFWYDNM